MEHQNYNVLQLVDVTQLFMYTLFFYKFILLGYLMLVLISQLFLIQ